MENEAYKLDKAIIKDQVFAAQITILYKNLLVSIIANFICAGLVFISLFNTSKGGLALSWFTTVILVSLLRFGILFLYKYRPLNMDQSLRIYIVGVVLSAILWGIAGSVLMPKGELMQQMIIIIIMAGITAGGIQSLSASLTASVLYISLIISPLCVWLFLSVPFM